MGKITRRIVTITVTETWTFVWAADVDHTVDAKRHPLTYPPAIVVNSTNPKEEADATLPITLNDTDPDPFNAHTTDPALDPPPSNAPGSATSRPRQRPRRRRSQNQPDT
ncbi:MAG: hypothetical protein U0350_29490 [Caldilineaceae bacterium]